MSPRHVRHAILLIALPSAVACGGKDPKEDEPVPVDRSKPLLPFAEGHSWTYDVTDSVATTRKVQTVHALEPVGGTGPHAAEEAFRVVTQKGDGADETHSWQGPDGPKIVRYREQAFNATTGALDQEEHWDPPKLRVDGSAAATAEGASWLENYQETKAPAVGSPVTASRTDRWTVINPAETVKVPAGTFTAVVLEKAGSGAKRYWYVHGIGKVKETGTQTEELTEYDVE